MKISAENFRNLMNRVAPVVAASNMREDLKYIQVKCDGNILSAVATDRFSMMQYQCEIKGYCDETFYLLPIKLEKSFRGDVEIKNENNFTIVTYEKTTIQIDNSINYPDISKLLQPNSYAKVRLDKKQLNQLLKCCDKYIDLYLSDSPNRVVYIETVDAKGLICPTKNIEW